MIKPSIGHVVWFTPVSNTGSSDFAPGAPLAAIVAHVHSDRCVNLGVFDANGVVHSRCSVTLLQDDDAKPENGYYAEWMPFQKGQAAKTEAIEAQVKLQSAPLTDEQSTEAAIQKAGKTAPRITPADIDAAIIDCQFFTAFDGIMGNEVNEPTGATVTRSNPPSPFQLLTFCVLVLRNGFTVTGESACASPENFDPAIGRDIARRNAREKIWLLEGYLLKQRLHDWANPGPSTAE